MKVETGLENYNSYKYRGLFGVVDRVKCEEQFFHESFIDELTRQVSKLVSEKLSVDIPTLKRKGVSLETLQYLYPPVPTVLEFKNDWYIRLMIHCRDTPSFMLVKCSSADEEKMTVDPHVKLEQDVVFEIVYQADPLLKEKRYAHIKSRTENVEENKKLYDELMSPENTSDSDWVDRVKSILDLSYFD